MMMILRSDSSMTGGEAACCRSEDRREGSGEGDIICFDLIVPEI